MPLGSFRLPRLQQQPSTFDLEFVTHGRHYRFGFCVDDERIVQEWLVRIAGSREKPVYERRTHSDGRVEIIAPGLTRSGRPLAGLAGTQVPLNQSFLATARWTLAHLGEALGEVIEWLEEDLTVLGLSSTPGRLGQHLATHQDFREFASAFLKAACTGVDRIDVDRRELTAEEVRALIPGAVMSLIQRQDATILLPDCADLVIEATPTGERCHRVAIQAVHRLGTPREMTLKLAEESDGTRRLLELMPALYQMRRGHAVFFIDEIERGMHPLLVHKLLEHFLTHTAGACQIILTTHETHMLTLDLLRRDEIWLAQKDATGASNLYALADLNVGDALRLRDGHPERRFGPVPFLGEGLIGTRGKTAPRH